MISKLFVTAVFVTIPLDPKLDDTAVFLLTFGFAPLRLENEGHSISAFKVHFRLLKHLSFCLVKFGRYPKALDNKDPGCKAHI